MVIRVLQGVTECDKCVAAPAMRVLQECDGVLQGCQKGLTRACHECGNSVVRVWQECGKSVARV
jgi:hypothetical protein